MGGRGAFSHSYKGQIKKINAEIKTLDTEIKKRQAWGNQVYDDEKKKTNEILATAARKYEYKLNGYYGLIAERTKLKKQLEMIEKLKKGKAR